MDNKMVQKTFILWILLLSVFSSYTYARRKSTRDSPSMSYSPSSYYSQEYNAAYRRAAVMVNNNIVPKDDCYDATGKAKKCVVSEFGNIAVQKTVTSTSTCGSPPNRYCNRVAIPSGGEITQCYVCDANHMDRRNPPEYVVDSNPKTCWVSQIFNDSSAGNEVSLTISLKKKYELTYIIIPFCNKLPESIALYKSADFGRRWTPLQYYSSDCKGMYGLERNGIITMADEQAAICKDIYSFSNPYTNTRIAFSMVEGRPSAHDIENSPILRDWVTVTDVKVVFNRLSAPKEIPSERETNYYSISEMTLGGRCKCNGHASKCSADETGNMRCECKHNTAGPDCDVCKDFYVDRPWNPATNENANECVGKVINIFSSYVLDYESNFYCPKKYGNVFSFICL